MPANTAPAKIGRYQTRLSRIVDLLNSYPVTDPVPGKPGETRTSTIWRGLLYKSDGKTVDTMHEWEASGAFRNQRGVANPNDLALLMRDLTAEELAAGLAQLPESARPAGSAAVSLESAVEVEPPKPNPLDDPRIDKTLLTELTWGVYRYMLKGAVQKGMLPANPKPQQTEIRGAWAELIASTVVSYLDHPVTGTGEEEEEGDGANSSKPADNQPTA